MRTYEVVVVLAPTASSEEIEAFVAQMTEVVEGKNGKVANVEHRGKETLAYRIQRFREGYYLIFTIESDGSAISELERRLRVLDMAIRYLSVRIDESMKRAEKIKAMRRRKSKPAPSPEAGEVASESSA